MNIKNYIEVLPEVEKAVASGKPVLALESTILSHGMPYPENMAFAKKAEEIARSYGVVPATAAIINGKLKVGLTEAELEIMCKAENVAKVSRRDLPVLVATGATGATTVATTMVLAAMAGIEVFATGGLGGVHRGAEVSFDISADLQELANTPVAVVCAGCKSILDIDLTLQYLETYGVPVLGLDTDEFPAFYSRKSGFGVDYNAKTAKAVAEIARAKWDLGLKGGIVVANPVPEEFEIPFETMEPVILKALEEAKAAGVRGKDITPFLLAKLVSITGGDSLHTNQELAYHNIAKGAEIALEIARLK